MQRRTIYIVMALMAALTLAACSPAVRYSASNSRPPERIGKREISYDYRRSAVIAEAMRWIGVPYCFGGEDRSCTDCSGFVQSVFMSAGIELPRTAASQYENARIIPESIADPGDLVFFSEGGRVSHVGVYLGGNEIVHASSSRGVIRQSLDDYWLSSRRTGFGRVID